jgi:anti-anti-sigma factor
MKLIEQSDIDALLRSFDAGSIAGVDLTITGVILRPDVVHISIAGAPLDYMNGSKLIFPFCQHILALAAHIVLEMPALPYLSSMGLAGLAKLATNDRKAGFKVCLVKVTDSFRELLRETNLDRIIHPCATIEEALEHLPPPN